MCTTLYIFLIMYTCVVPNCKSVSQLLRFPKDKKLLKKWLAILGNPILRKMRFGQIFKSKRICADHFENDCFVNNDVINKLLKNDVLPSLNLPDNPNKISCRAHLYTYFMIDPHTNKVINKSFSKLLKEEALNLWAVDRNCALLFTIMSLKPELKYNSEFDQILGFHTANGKSNNIFAEKVIIFMLKGLYTNWKQLISFTFTGENVDKEVLIQSIQDVIATCISIKFRIVATICEASDCNISVMNELKYSTHQNCQVDENLGYESFVFDDREIIILYDASNLLKRIRNEFLHHNYQFTTDNVQHTANWRDIASYVTESREKIEHLNLNDACLHPNKIKINSRRQCLQIFNNELLISIQNSLKNENFKANYPNLEGTAKFLQLFTDLFDSLNGNSNKKPLNRPLFRTVSPGSKHWEFWTECLKILNTVKLSKDGNVFRPIFIEKWITTIGGLMNLWRGILQKAKFKSFSPKYLQLRELENDTYEIWTQGIKDLKQRRLRRAFITSSFP